MFKRSIQSLFFFRLSMAHLLNLKINTESSFFGLSMAHLLNLSSVLSTIHLLTLLILCRGVCSTLVESYPSRVWGSQWGEGAYLRGILFQGFQRCGWSRRRLSTLFLRWSPIRPECGVLNGGAYLRESCSRDSQRCGWSRRRLSTLFLRWSLIRPECQQVQGSPKV